MHDLIGFLLAGFALAGSPGPATLSLAATGAAFGRRGGLAYMAGIVAGMIVVMAITAGGITGLVMTLPLVARTVTILAALYFVYLAWRIATAPPLEETSAAQSPPSFGGGLFLSLINPKGYAAMAALFSGFVLVDAGVALDALLKMLVLLAVMLVVNTGWLLLGAILTRWFRQPGTNRAINVSFAVLLIVSVAFALRF